MIGLSTIVKLAKGGVGPDELGELMALAGMDCSFTSVQVSSEPFAKLAQSASATGVRLVELRGTMRGGETLHALLVLG